MDTKYQREIYLCWITLNFVFRESFFIVKDLSFLPFVLCWSCFTMHCSWDFEAILFKYQVWYHFGPSSRRAVYWNFFKCDRLNFMSCHVCFGLSYLFIYLYIIWSNKQRSVQWQPKNKLSIHFGKRYTELLIIKSYTEKLNSSKTITFVLILVLLYKMIRGPPCIKHTIFVLFLLTRMKVEHIRK